MNTNSPKWLEDPTPFVDHYVSRKEIVKQLSENPEVLYEFLVNFTVSLSNQQVSQTAEHANRWISDIEKAQRSEPVNDMQIQYGEEDSLDTLKKANELLASLMTYTRSCRSFFSSKTNTTQFRKQ